MIIMIDISNLPGDLRTCDQNALSETLKVYRTYKLDASSNGIFLGKYVNTMAPDAPLLGV